MRSKIKKYSQSKGKSDFLLVSDNTIIGRTTVVLKISEHKESNLGDFVADGMVDWVSFLLPNVFTTGREITSMNIHSRYLIKIL